MFPLSRMARSNPNLFLHIFDDFKDSKAFWKNPKKLWVKIPKDRPSWLLQIFIQLLQMPLVLIPFFSMAQIFLTTGCWWWWSVMVNDGQWWSVMISDGMMMVDDGQWWSVIVGDGMMMVGDGRWWYDDGRWWSVMVWWWSVMVGDGMMMVDDGRWWYGDGRWWYGDWRLIMRLVWKNWPCNKIDLEATWIWWWTWLW